MNTLANGKSLSDNAYNEIKNMILDGRLKQGQPISINAMTEILGISRTPITNACQRLEYEKFLKILPKQGVVINSLTLEDVRELYELRAAIETYSAKRAFSHIHKEDIDVLKKSLEKQKKYIQTNDVYKFMKEDTFFHKYLLGKYDNSHFFSIVNTLYDRAFIASLKSGEYPERLEQNIVEHENIVQNLVDGNKEGFVDAVEMNILNGYINLTGNYKLE